MTLAMELERKKQEGIKEEIELTALKMLKDKLPKITITKYTNLTAEEIDTLAKMHHLN